MQDEWTDMALSANAAEPMRPVPTILDSLQPISTSPRVYLIGGAFVSQSRP